MTGLELTPTAHSVGVPAQAAGADWLTVVAWCTVLAGAVVALVLGIVMARRWLYEDHRPAVWTLQDLRDMRDRGELTVAQFEHMRARVIGGWTAEPEDDAERPRGDPG